MKINSPTAAQGVEIISFVTTSAGEHTLEIKSSDKSAVKGFYKLSFEESVAATEKHRNRVKADKLFAEAETWKFNPTAETIQNALPKYDEARVLYYLGQNYIELNNLPKAKEFLPRKSNQSTMPTARANVFLRRTMNSILTAITKQIFRFSVPRRANGGIRNLPTAEMPLLLSAHQPTKSFR